MSRFTWCLLLLVGCNADMRGKPGDPNNPGNPQKPLVCNLGCPSGFRCESGVCVGGDPSSLAFDARTVSLSGTLTFDGAAPSGVGGCSSSWLASLGFRGQDGASFSAEVPCPSAGGAFSVRLQPGTYRVTAHANTNVNGLPEGTFVLERALVVDDTTGTLSFDVTTVPVSGKLLFDGAAPGGGASCSSSWLASMSFRGEDGASFSAEVPCPSSGGAFSARIQPGTYRVTAHANTNVSGLPAGTFVVERALQVGGARSGLSFDARTVPVSGKLLFDGVAAGGGTSCSSSWLASLSFATEEGASFSAEVPCPSTGGAFTARVQPGTYRVIAHANTNVSGLPQGSFVLDRALQVSASRSGLSFDARTVAVGGTLRFDGVAPGGASNCPSSWLASLSFYSDDGASFSAEVTCPSTGGRFATRVAPGTYRVTAHANTNVSGLPEGTFLLDRALMVAGANQALSYDARTVPVSGQLRFDGVAPGGSSGSCPSSWLASLSFSGERTPLPGILGDLGLTHGTSFSAEVPCPSSGGRFSTRLAPGTYRVTVHANTNVPSLPAGTFTLVDDIVLE
jgi:hypothetical protein